MKNFVVLIIVIAALLQVVRAQDTPSKISDAEGREMLGTITNLHLGRVSFAYRSVAIQQMLSEANYFSQHLKLQPCPIQLSDIKNVYVSAPLFSMIEDFNTLLKESDNQQTRIAKIRTARICPAGFIETTNFCFYFHKGYLWSVVNRIHHLERFDLYPTWAKTPSLVDTNGAYQLAVQWLSAISVDTVALEKKYPPKATQRFFYPDAKGLHDPPDLRKRVAMLPIFDLKWGEDDSPALNVTILGTSKELIELHMDNTSFSRRPLLIITNAIELTSIPDPPVKQLQRPSSP
jgi:hypothetical protein